ncbi:MAG: hypothetical protein C5617_004150, partial [ANME-2 cluster archaeon]
MRGSKESAAILLILLLAATALSSPSSFPDEHLCYNYTGVGTSGDFKVVNISDDPSFSSRVGCGLVRLPIRSDEVSQDCTISNTLRAVDSHEQISYNVTRSPRDAFNTLYALLFATTTLSGVVYDEYENPIKGAIVEWTDCDDNDVVSDTTDADGKFSLTATSGSYKLKVVYNGVTYPFTINNEECYNYPPGTYTLDLTIRTTATLTGMVQDEDGDPLDDATVKWTDCNDNYVVADITDADGKFLLTAAAGFYKLKVKYNGIMYPCTINGEECPYYGPDTWNLNNPLTIRTRTTLHGYIKDLDNKPLHGLTVALHACTGGFAASDDTDSSGHFSITTDAGDYEIFIEVMEGYQIQILDNDGNSCFLLVGDADLGTLKISPTPDCSRYNYLCYGPEMNIKLFNCYWDDGCWCFMQECPCGCTDGLTECDSCETGTVHIDVDNRNNDKPQPGAKIYLDDAYQGTTDSLGKKGVNAGYGSHEIRVECPVGTGCGSKELYVNGDEYLYFDCDCDTRLAALQVNVDNINSYPVANVYVYVDGEERALTCPFGYVYIEDVPYGDRHIDIRYSITNPDFLGDYQKSLDITVDEEKEVVNFIATLPDRSQLAQARSIGDSSNFTRIENFTPQVLPVAAAAMAVIDIASVTWSTDEFCRCMFQEEGSSGIEQCIDAITDCGGDTRGCIGQIREIAGPAANRCKFEGAMLVGDGASPFIPVGFIGHGVAAVVGERRVLRIADNIGEDGRIVKTEAGGVVEYVKGGVSWAARWVEGVGFKLGIIHYVSWWDELSQPALDGWNKALKNADRGAGKELLEDIGKARADRAGKNLAGMSDDAAEWMAESEIGRTAMKRWGDDAQKGLAEIFEEKGEWFTDNLARRFGDEVEIVSKGVGREVIDADRVNPEKLAVYVRGTGKIGVADPLDDIGRHQLLRMMKSPHVTTKVVDDGGKTVEVIDRVAVSKKGEHLGPNNGWGWEHMVGEDHHNQIKEAFNLADNDKAVKDFIAEGLEKGYANPDSSIEIIYEPEGFRKKLQIVLSPDYLV